MNQPFSARKRACGVDKSIDELIGIVARLRARDGCPWDREQTHESIIPDMLDEVYDRCKKSVAEETPENHVNLLYDLYTDEEISGKIGDIVRPEKFNSGLEIVYQTVTNLHKAIPNHSGDWYFTGNFPTIGGNRVVNKAFINFMEGNLVRAY